MLELLQGNLVFLTDQPKKNKQFLTNVFLRLSAQSNRNIDKIPKTTFQSFPLPNEESFTCDLTQKFGINGTLSSTQIDKLTFYQKDRVF